MKRWIACGVAAGWLAGTSAADPVPVSVYPATPKTLEVIPPAAAPVRTLPGTVVPAQATTRPVVQAATPDVTRPLSSVLETVPPAAPSAAPALIAPTVIAAPADCGVCGPAQSGSYLSQRRLGASSCWDRLCNYFAWKPGPRVLPICVPTPYQPPLRHYFPVNPAPNLITAPGAAAGCGSGGRAPFFGSPLSGSGACGAGERSPPFGPRLFGFSRGSAGGCADGRCNGGRCDGCHEGLIERACARLARRQFGRRQPNCWGTPGTPVVSDCAASGCNGTAAVAVGAVPACGGIYPGMGGGYRFASPVFVPPAAAVVASGAGGVGSGIGGGPVSGAVGGNVGAVGTGAPGAGVGGGTGGAGGGPGR